MESTTVYDAALSKQILRTTVYATVLEYINLTNSWSNFFVSNTYECLFLVLGLWYIFKYNINPLSPHDALKHHFCILEEWLNSYT